MSGLNDFFNMSFPIDLTSIFKEGELPAGSRVYRRDILDVDGTKVGEKVVRTYSAGRNRPSKEVVRASYPPVNIYTNNEGYRVFEFACAGYDSKNISFEINKEDPEYIDLVLKSGVKTVKENDEKESVQELRAYDCEGFKVKDARVPFYVDSSRYNTEEPTVEFTNGIVRITFEPKKKILNIKYK